MDTAAQESMSGDAEERAISAVAQRRPEATQRRSETLGIFETAEAKEYLSPPENLSPEDKTRWEFVKDKVLKLEEYKEVLSGTVSLMLVLEVRAQIEGVLSVLEGKNLDENEIKTLLYEYARWKDQVAKMTLDDFSDVMSSQPSEQENKKAELRLLIFIRAVKRNVNPDVIEKEMRTPVAVKGDESDKRMGTALELAHRHPIVAFRLIADYYKVIDARRRLRIITMSSDLLDSQIKEEEDQLSAIEIANPGENATTLEIRSLKADLARLNQEKETRSKNGKGIDAQQQRRQE